MGLNLLSFMKMGCPCMRCGGVASCGVVSDGGLDVSRRLIHDCGLPKDTIGIILPSQALSKLKGCLDETLLYGLTAQPLRARGRVLLAQITTFNLPSRNATTFSPLACRNACLNDVQGRCPTCANQRRPICAWAAPPSPKETVWVYPCR